MKMYYYPAAQQFYVMAVLSGTRVVRVLRMVMATRLYAAAFVCVGVAAEFARLRLTTPGSASTKHFLLLIMPNRRDCAKSVSASNDDLNMR